MTSTVRTALNLVVKKTPLLGVGIGILVATTPARGAPWYVAGAGGAISGALVSLVWEYTVNSSDAPEEKTGIILGTAALGGASGTLSSILVGTLPSY